MEKKKRLIPVLLLKNGMLVQSRGFNRHQILGNPITAVKRLSEWASDELIYLDISRDDSYDLKRDDQGYENIRSFLGIIEYISKETFMPITIGGKIKKLSDIEKRLMLCADRVSINSKAIDEKKFISNAAKEFGSQCIVISVDAKRVGNEFYVFGNFGKINSNIKVRDWLKIVQEEGAGEILLNSIDNDGQGLGYDIELLEQIPPDIKVPIIISGGVGDYLDFEEGLKNPKIDAVAAANIFHYRDQSVYLAKKYLYDEGYNVRRPDLLNL